MTPCSGLIPHRLPLAAALAAGLLLAGGCTRQTQVEVGTKTGIFHIALASEPADLDPNTNISADAEPIFDSLFEGLVTLSNDGATIRPGVSDHWEISEDQRTYTFHLRDTARWSNGAPVTADDFVFSFRRIFDPKLGCEESSFGYPIAGAEAYNRGRTPDPATVGVSAPDPHTVVIKLERPTPYFLGILGGGTPFLPVYHPLLEKFNGVHERGTGWSREGVMISNGPFILAGWTQDKVIVVKRNPSYWGQVPLNEIHFYPIDDADAQERGFRAGQFHVTMRFPVSRAPSYQSSPLLAIAPTLNIQFVTLNTKRFPDARIRRALSLALDREKMVPAVYHEFATAAHSLTRPGTGGYQPPASAICHYRPDEARALLAAAGYPEGKGFPPIELMLVGNSQETIKMGEVVQAAWKNVLGISTTLLPTESKVYLDAERSQHYTAIIEHWGSSWDDPTAVLQTGVSNDPNNDTGWINADFDRAYLRATSLPLSPARTQAFDEQETILAGEAPYLPLFYQNYGHLIDPAVKGWKFNAVNTINWKEISLQN